MLPPALAAAAGLPRPVLRAGDTVTACVMNLGYKEERVWEPRHDGAGSVLTSRRTLLSLRTRTASGASVAMHVRVCDPRLWVSCPRGWGAADAAAFGVWLDEHVREAAEARAAKLARRGGGVDLSHTAHVVGVDVERGVHSLCGYAPPWAESTKLCIRVAVPGLVGVARELLANIHDLVRRGVPPPCVARAGESELDALSDMYEASIDYTLVACVEADLRPGHWVVVTLPPALPHRERLYPGLDYETTLGAGLSALGRAQHITALPPWRVASFDIEVDIVAGVFPHPHAADYPVFCISVASLTTQCTVTFTCGGALPEDAGGCLRDEPGTSSVPSEAGITKRLLVTYERESDMLVAWAEFMRAGQWDVVTGWNSNGYDFYYLHTRAERLGIASRMVLGAGASAFWTRESTVTNAQKGTRKKVTVELGGGSFAVCGMEACKDAYPQESSYSLDEFARTRLGRHKVEVLYDRIPLMMRTPTGRYALAYYCETDAMLPLLILKRLTIIERLSSMATIVGVQLDIVAGKRGQRAWGVASYMYTLRGMSRQPGGRRYIMPYVPFAPTAAPGTVGPDASAAEVAAARAAARVARKEEREAADRAREAGTGYLGGYVMEPAASDKRLFEHGVETLDFASLYPNIMRENNMCPSAMVAGGYVAAVVAQDELTDAGIASRLFRMPSMTKSNESVFTDTDVSFLVLRNDAGELVVPVTPRILASLAEERKAWKAVMAAAGARGGEDDEEYQIADSRQLAIKVTMNSIYGNLGANLVPGTKDIGRMVAVEGRRCIMRVKDFVTRALRPDSDLPEHVRDRLTRDMGVGGLRVVYGDTDSVFVEVTPAAGRVIAPGDHTAIGTLLCERTTEQLFGPAGSTHMKLAYEKVLLWFCITAPKRYIGLRVEGATCKPMIRGFDRRDLVPIVKTLMKTAVGTLVADNDDSKETRLQKVAAHVRRTLTAIRNLDVEIHTLVETCNLSKTWEAYEACGSATLPQVMLAKRLEATGRGTTFAPGTRIQYVVGNKDHPWFSTPAAHATLGTTPVRATGRLREHGDKIGARLLRPDELFDTNVNAVGMKRLDVGYYLGKVVQMATKTLACAFGGEAAMRAACLPRGLLQPRSTGRTGDATGLGTWLEVRLPCAVSGCGARVKHEEAVCSACVTATGNPSVAALRARTAERVAALEAREREHAVQCGKCLYGATTTHVVDIEEWEAECSTFTCPRYSSRYQTRTERNDPTGPVALAARLGARA